MITTNIKIIENQSEIENPNTNYDEAQDILKKYGYEEQISTIKEESKLSFEEMIKLNNDKEKQKKQNIKPITFDGDYDSHIKYQTDEETNIGFRIQIVSDMKIPKY